MAAAAEEWGDWTAVPDDEGGSYFWNLKTGETRWDAPPSVSPRAREDSRSQAASSSSAWARAVADDGSEYWYNGETGATSWDPPEAPSAGGAAGEERALDLLHSTWSSPTAAALGAEEAEPPGSEHRPRPQRPMTGPMTELAHAVAALAGEREACARLATHIARLHPPCYTILYYTILYYTILYYTTLYYTTLYYGTPIL